MALATGNPYHRGKGEGGGQFTSKSEAGQGEGDQLALPKPREPKLLPAPHPSKTMVRDGEAYLNFDASNPRGFYAQFHDGMTGLNLIQRGAIDTYLLREGNIDQANWSGLTASLDELTKNGKLSESVVLYRGMTPNVARVIAGMKVGEAIRSDAFMPTTPRPLGMQDNMRIFADHGSHAIVFGAHAVGLPPGGFDEVLFARGSKLIYQGVGTDGVPEFKLDQDVKADLTGLEENVVDIGGDVWNREMAVELEREYAAAKPKVEALSKDVGKDISAEVFDRTSWSSMTDDEKDKVWGGFHQANYQPFLQEQIANWKQDGHGPEDAKRLLMDTYTNLLSWYSGKLESFSDDEHNASQIVGVVRVAINEHINGVKGFDPELGQEIIEGGREQQGLPRIPYTTENLMKALIMNGSNGKIDFNDAALRNPDTKPPLSQLTLPGMGEADYSKALTKEMRESLITAINDAIDAASENFVENMNPPGYLGEAVDDEISELWDGMEDDEKYTWAMQHDLVPSGFVEEEYSDMTKPVKMPDKLDPLAETDNQNYRDTKALAKRMSLQRAVEIAKERGLKDSSGKELNIRSFARIDAALWSGWKSSATSPNGNIIQVATAEELGTRVLLRTGERAGGADPDKAKEDANGDFYFSGGYDGIKAYIRAKWETTQWLLDKSDHDVVDLYREVDMIEARPRDEDMFVGPISINQVDKWQIGGIGKKEPEYKKAYDSPEEAQSAMEAIKERINTGKRRIERVDGFEKMPNLPIERNGAASFTTDRNIANTWGDDNERVVIRARVPRTTIVSVPAYGQNVYGEHEVIVAGGPFVKWDAWRGSAPSFDEVSP